MGTRYMPKPIDTSGVTLPRELAGLGELLARHVHDNWSAGRLAEGWTHGPVRDDDARRHPLLVPYEKLTAELSASGRGWRISPRLPGAPAASALCSSLAKPPSGLGHAQSSARSRSVGFRQQIVALLFADAVSFSHLNDDQVPRFHTHSVGLVASLSVRARGRPLAEHLGRQVHFVSGDVAAAGRFALALCGAVSRTRWENQGLPADLNLRLTLHAGPTGACIDRSRAVRAASARTSAARRASSRSRPSGGSTRATCSPPWSRWPESPTSSVSMPVSGRWPGTRVCVRRTLSSDGRIVCNPS